MSLTTELMDDYYKEFPEDKPNDLLRWLE